MICAGKGAGVIANIWNGSLDKKNICTMLRAGDRGVRGKALRNAGARHVRKRSD